MEKNKTARFPNPLHRHLVKIDNGVYVSANDPNAYEKMLRYGDRTSPETHYMLGKKYEELGDKPKALHHYREAARTSSSPYYGRAYEGIRRLTRPAVVQAVPAVSVSAAARVGRKPATAAVRGGRGALWVGIAASLLLLALLAAEAVLSSVKPAATVGKRVTYEASVRPFFVYLPYDANDAKVAETMRSKAAEAARDGRDGVRLYGLWTADASLYDKVVPLDAVPDGETKKRGAFVLAEYDPSVDKAVRIRFFPQEGGTAKAPGEGAFTRPALSPAGRTSYALPPSGD
ncbi:tetratricopeptide repeat protein [Paenibacillus flagellatus]|uniref:Uncharacterized protein n=1 Tax=Paenibacillus flagellatus TaxID=2211139 RepID=A0A2V5JVI6_9BACL|nr:tetratricopeptide repeat protein [Paenibacillus flagellatus]PYI50491.1 hypothetical protein DLM86_28740 [Paenibacillus flagellatus]